MGKVVAVCVSKKRGTAKTSVGHVRLEAGFGIIGDAHAGHWHRQVGLLDCERIEQFRQEGANVDRKAKS